MKQKRILITGGGTGGHLSPGVAIYEEMKARELRPVFCAGKADSRFPIMDSVSPRDLIYYDAPPFTKNIFKLPFFPVRFLAAVLKIARIIRRKNIEAVVGMGGYVSAPALLAAKMLKTPIFLCEQNSVPGKVTSMFEKKAKRIYGTFEVSKEYLKNKEGFVNVGNPIRKQVLEYVSKEEAKKIFHLGHCSKVVLLIGGSQGALKLNKLMLDLRKKYSAEMQGVGIIWSTGSASHDEFREKVHELDEGSIYIAGYIDKIGLAYRASDLAISRSGSGVMMELAAVGLPSILVPYPFAAMDHQNKNADVFCAEGASIKISDNDALADKVAPVLLELLDNKRKLEKMSECNTAISKKDAASVILDDILSLI